jgi:hypothetical protein
MGHQPVSGEGLLEYKRKVRLGAWLPVDGVLDELTKKLTMLAYEPGRCDVYGLASWNPGMRKNKTHSKDESAGRR